MISSDNTDLLSDSEKINWLQAKIVQYDMLFEDLFKATMTLVALLRASDVLDAAKVELILAPFEKRMLWVETNKPAVKTG